MPAVHLCNTHLAAQSKDPWLEAVNKTRVSALLGNIGGTILWCGISATIPSWRLSKLNRRLAVR